MMQRSKSRPFRMSACLLAWLVAAEPLGAALPRERAAPADRGASTDALESPRREPPVARPQPRFPVFSAAPTDREIFEARVFFEPLVPGDGTVDVDENRALAAAVLDYLHGGGGDDLEPILDFLAAHPGSRWRGALLTSAGMAYLRSGYISRALAYLERGWEALKEETEPQARGLADRALAEHAQLNARLGRADVLEPLFAGIEHRNVRGSATEMLSGARQGLWLMKNKPGEAFRCGPMALDRLLAFDNPDYRLDEKIVGSVSTPRGMSLTQVWELSRELDMGLRMAKREPGADLVTPSVVHWKAGHFAAVLTSKEGHYMVEDPTFGNRKWITRDALVEESSGYFLVPESDATKGFRPVEEAEGETVWGKGNTLGQDPQAIKSCDFKSGGDGCAGSCSSPGFASYRFHSMMVSLNITDTPLGYTPPLGPEVSFLMTYNQRESFQPVNFTHSHIGRKWTFDWMSYVEDDPTFLQERVTVYSRGGGIEEYLDIAGVGEFEPHIQTRARLVRVTQDPIEYRREHPDGSTETFSVADGTGYPRRIFLTQWADPQGNAVTFHYDGVKLVSVEDAIGQHTTLSYDDPLDPFRITSVTDPFPTARTAALAYNEDGMLESITDVGGLTSQFEYGEGDFISALTTPYGRTEFTTGERIGLETFGVDRWLEAVDPVGGRERIEFVISHPTFTTQAPAGDVPATPWVHNANLNYRNTFYWDKLAMDRHPGDYDKAHVTQWLKTGGAGDLNLTSGVKASEKFPLESRIWYHYPDQLTFNRGSSVQPTEIARVMDDGTDQVIALEFNSNGLLSRFVDPLGRESVYEYADNDIDLERIKQKRGAGYDLLSSATYNDQHRPETITDTSGRTTHFTYYPDGHVDTITNARKEQWDFDYDPSHYLEHVTGPLPGATVDVAWDGFGRVRTVTAEGGAVSFDYDVFDRLTRLTFPDGTHESLAYDRFDLSEFRDRLGRASRAFYDPLGRIVALRDALGVTVHQQWCNCGALSAFVDGDGNRTAWEWDDAGRLVKEIRADQSEVELTYLPKSGELERVETPGGRLTKYEYFRDGSLESIRTTDADDADLVPPLSFTYDPDYRRPLTKLDGTGQTSYVYEPIETPPSLGAGRLRFVDGPLPNDVIAYTYDELGRVDAQSLNGVSWTRAFDALGRVTHHTNALGAFVYDYVGASGRPETMHFPGGETTRFDYFGLSGDVRLQEVVHETAGGTLLSRHAFAYDGIGNPESWLFESDPAPPKVYDLAYDRGDRLIGAVLETGGSTPAVVERHAYAYDDAGNRTTHQVDDAPRAGVHNEMNQLTRVEAGGTLRFAGTVSELAKVEIQGQPTANGPGLIFAGSAPVSLGPNSVEIEATDLNNNVRTDIYDVVVDESVATRAFTHDAGGNLDDDGARTYEWDALDQLVAVVEGARRSELAYDGFGRRVRIVERDGPIVLSDTRFVWCGSTICEQRDATGATTDKRFFPQGVEVGGTRYFYRRDYLGSIREVTDSSGALRAGYDYGPWGARTKRAGDLEFEHGFTGHYTHQPSELVLAPYRTYDPRIGRWLSMDPIGMAGGLNLYRYAANSPVNAVDRSGASPTLISGAAGAVLGGVIGAGATWWNSPDASAADILSAAGSGALLGGLTGLTAGAASGLAGTLGTSFWATVVARPAGSAAANVVEQSASIAFEWQCGFEWEQVVFAAAAGGGGRLLGAAGRRGRQTRLRQLASDPKVSSADRGWLRQELNQISRGKRNSIRNPPGKQLAHERGREAAKGFDHMESPSHLQDQVLHRTQHKFDNFGRRNRRR